jgi:hypothetical protein
MGEESAAPGSSSNGPKASMIHRGVKWTCEVPMVLWWLPEVRPNLSDWYADLASIARTLLQ